MIITTIGCQYYECKNCFAIKACRFGAISQVEGKEPKIDANKCTACGDCISHCPNDSLKMTPDRQERKEMQKVLIELGATERLIKIVGLKGYGAGRALFWLGDLRQYKGWGDEQKEAKIINFAYDQQALRERKETNKNAEQQTSNISTMDVALIYKLCKMPLWIAARMAIDDTSSLKNVLYAMSKADAFIVLKDESPPHTYLINPNDGARGYSVFTSFEQGLDYAINSKNSGVVAVGQTTLASLIENIKNNEHGVTRVIVDMHIELNEADIALAEKIIVVNGIVVKLNDSEMVASVPQNVIEIDGFVRRFDISKLDNLSEKDAHLFTKLKADVLKGKVFPAVRKDELHFYYKGGCLYRFANGSFKRNLAYDKIETMETSDYKKAKEQCKIRFSRKGNSAKERQLLDKLNYHTFKQGSTSKVVVLDIEVNLNGEKSGQKKCDMVLLNKETSEIMFVEGKVFKDKRVNRRVGETPEVIEQVATYSAGIAEQATTIVKQYAEHIKIVNALFGTEYNTKVKLIPTAKLLVYETPITPNANGQYSIDTINNALGSKNILWATVGSEPTLNEIWDTLCK